MQKPFVVMEAVVEGGAKTALGDFDTYAAACDFVGALDRARIPFCSIDCKPVPKKDTKFHEMWTKDKDRI